MARSKKIISKDKPPLWVIVGVILGAIIVYVAMKEGKKREVSGVPAIDTSSAQSVNLSPVRDEVVIAEEGIVARNDAPPGTPLAPMRSEPLTEDMVPKEAVRLMATKDEFVPSRFMARPGEVVTLAFSSGDGFTHVLAFENPGLQAIALGISSGETRAIRFNAPEEEGEYVFYQNIPGFENVRGVMIVKK